MVKKWITSEVTVRVELIGRKYEDNGRSGIRWQKALPVMADSRYLKKRSRPVVTEMKLGACDKW